MKGKNMTSPLKAHTFKFFRLLSSNIYVPDTALKTNRIKAPNLKIACLSYFIAFKDVVLPSNLYIREKNSPHYHSVVQLVHRYGIRELAKQNTQVNVLDLEMQKLLHKRRETNRKSYFKNWSMRQAEKKVEYNRAMRQYNRERELLLKLGFSPEICPEWKDRNKGNCN